MLKDHPRLTIVTHEEIYEKPENLPTFSSPSIESQISNIPGLSEKFLVCWNLYLIILFLPIFISIHFSTSTMTCFLEKRFGPTIFMTVAQAKKYTFLGLCPTVLQVALILGLKMVIVIQSVILQDACTTDTIALGQTSKWDLAEETVTWISNGMIRQ